MSFLSVRGLSRTFDGGTSPALHQVSIEVDQGQCLAVLGPSGAGKSTLLRIVAGLDAPTTGSVELLGRDLEQTLPEDRGMGMVFQRPLLFPHLSVVDNVAFSARVTGTPVRVARQRAERFLDLVELGGYGGRRVTQLSGGQAQRVALARALAAEPRVLLLDEPFGALDQSLRETMHDLVRHIRAELNPTIVLVTHEPMEAAALADRVAILERGALLQYGSVEAVIWRPVSEQVHRLMGGRNIVRGVLRGGCHVSELGRLGIPAQQVSDRAVVDGPASLLIRQEAVRITQGGEEPLPGVVVETTPLGARCRVVVEVGHNQTLTAELLASQAPQPGDQVNLAIDHGARWVVSTQC